MQGGYQKVIDCLSHLLCNYGCNVHSLWLPPQAFLVWPRVTTWLASSPQTQNRPVLARVIAAM